MDQRLIELYVQRGRLRERIDTQRRQVARDLAPLSHALAGVDRARSVWHQTQQWMRVHPGLVTAAVVALMVWRPRPIFRSLRWGYRSWRQWARLRAWFSSGVQPF